MNFAMHKIVTPDAYDYGDEQVAVVPLRRDGTIGSSDRSTFLKRASASILTKAAKLKPLPGETWVHGYALGSTEGFGSNRNGDGFPKDACAEYHDTFVKHALFFRNHKAKDRTKNYGCVKLSEFNEDQQRVELIMALSSTKEAADRLNGLIADQELQKLASGKGIDLSMGCGVPYDECSYCGNRAKTRASYCGEEMCKAGGLKNHIGQLVEVDGDLHQLHAINRHPCFGDISNVGRGADRIAKVTSLLRKAASAGGTPVVSGAELAELMYGAESKWTKLGESLVLSITQEIPKEILRALPRRTTLPPLHELPPMDKLGELTAALADQDIILPIDRFVELISGRTPHNPLLLKQAAIAALSCLQIDEYNPFDYVGPVSQKYANLARHLVQDFSLHPAALRRRAAIEADDSAVLLPLTKTAEADPFTQEVAQQYGAYVTGALARISRKTANIRLTAIAAVSQNRAH
ncbi:MAG TPA: hypothetical protein VNC50_08975 [Planctomycetia bacterium]|nr:hypothetical protein [Planctomycetia bacterium]